MKSGPPLWRGIPIIRILVGTICWNTMGVIHDVIRITPALTLSIAAKSIKQGNPVWRLCRMYITLRILK